MCNQKLAYLYVISVLMFFVGKASGAIINFDLHGTINDPIAGTTIITGDPFVASFQLDTTEAHQFVAGGFTLSNDAIDKASVIASVDNTGTFLHANTRTLNGSNELAIEIIFSKFDPPFNGVGNFGRLFFFFPDVMQNDDIGTLLLPSLQNATPYGWVEAQGAGSSGLTFDGVSISAVPLPASIWLLSIGMIGLLRYQRTDFSTG